MTATTFVTSKGCKARTGSSRRYVLVDNRDGEVLYRTDDKSRALLARRNFRSGMRLANPSNLDVIDTEGPTVLDPR